MVKLHDKMDASIWAREFMRLYKQFGYEPDEATMTGWFGSAIMVGYDHGYRHGKKERKAVQKSLDNSVDIKMW